MSADIRTIVLTSSSMGYAICFRLSGLGGKIDNQQGDDKPTKQKSPQKTLKFKTQAGAEEVNINTIRGRITQTK